MVLRPLPNDLQALILKHFNNCQIGFCWEEKALKLAEVVWTLHPKIAIEVGVYGGKSFIPIAAAMTYIDQNRNKHKSYGIDVWEAEEASKNYEAGHKEFWNNQNTLDLAYEHSKKCVEDLNSNCVELVKTTSKSFLTNFKDEEVDFLHIDGNHSEQESYDDIVTWWAKLSKGGVLALDDIGWVSEAGLNFCKERGSILWEYYYTPGSAWGSAIFFIKEKN